MERNRQGYLVSETHRECTNCGKVFNRTSKTVTLCNSCNSSRVKGQSPEQKMLQRARQRARESGLTCTIDVSDIRIPTHCPVLGIPLEVHKGTPGGRKNSPALDRVDNNKGYEKDNIVVISHLANMMKSSASKEELLKFSKWVQDTYSTPLRSNES